MLSMDNWSPALTLVWLVSTNMLVVVSPTPCPMGGEMMASRNVLFTASCSRVSVAPVSANCLTPSDTVEPILNKGEAAEEEWE